jgi:hypothetical protein
MVHVEIMPATHKVDHYTDLSKLFFEKILVCLGRIVWVIGSKAEAINFRNDLDYLSALLNQDGAALRL